MVSTMARDEDIILFADSLGWIGVRNESGHYDFLPEPRGPVERIALSADGSLGAALLKNGEIAIFSPQSREYLTHWRPTQSPRSLCLLDDNSTLILAHDDGTLSILEAKTGLSQVAPIPTPATGLEVMAVPHRAEFLSRSDEDLHVKRWCAHRGQLLHSGLRHRDGVLWFSCSLDGQFLFSIDQHEENATRSALRIWSLRTGEEIVPALEHSAAMNCATIYDNGRKIATACADGTIRRWTVPK